LNRCYPVLCALLITIWKRLAQVAANNKDVVAVLVEPFQGEGGVNIPEAHYLQGLRNLCDPEWLAADAR
jgi:acetylornithine/succinyldiaminopimelate/putrescine aminotransferase